MTDVGRRALGVLVTLAMLMASAPGTADVHGAFPGRNGRIAFIKTDLSTGSCPSGSIWTMQADGGAQRDLTGSIDFGVIGGVAWSPDGKRLAFTVQTSIHEPLDVIGVLVMNADGSGKEGLRNIPVRPGWRCDPQGPTWSPDGTLIAVAGVEGIYTIQAGGDHAVRVLTAGAPDVYDQPDWSPDGGSIAVRIAARGVIGVIPARGGDATPLLDRPIAAQHPSWSPDGWRIAYQVDIGATIGIIDRCRDVVSTLDVGSVRGELAPAWSPDGTQVAFWAIDGGKYDVYTVSAEGGEPVDLTNTYHPFVESAPDWQPTGKAPALEGCARDPIVNSAGDRADANPGNGRCDTGKRVRSKPECTLRAAIAEANTNGVPDVIRFAIPGGAEITVGDEELPPLEGRITIDGSTQEGVRLRAGAGQRGAGLRLAGNGNVVRGLTMTGFATGVAIDKGIGNAIVASSVGISGGRPDGHTTVAVDVTGGSGAMVGGRTTPGDCDADCNQLWGRLYGVSVAPDSKRTVIAGNHIAHGDYGSLQETGAAAVSVTGDAVIGGDTADLGNTITGQRGIEVAGGAVTIVSNSIQTSEIGIVVAAGVQGTAIGGFVAGDPGAAPGNHLLAQGIGIGEAGAGTTITGNLVEGGPGRAIGTGVMVQGTGTTVRANRIVGFSDAGLPFDEESGVGTGVILKDAGDTVVSGNVLGLGPDGRSPQGNDVGLFALRTASARIDGNTMSGNKVAGVWVKSDEPTLLTFTANRVGTDPSGVLAVANGVGLLIDGPGVVVGGPGGDRNIISGNLDHGVVVRRSVTVVGNRIGTDDTGRVAIPNGGAGVFVQAVQAREETVIGGVDAGAGNVIAGNGGPGVWVGAFPLDLGFATIRGNSIRDNGGIGIDLANLENGAILPDGVTPNDILDDDAGANGLTNFPVIRTLTVEGSSVTVSGDVMTNGLGDYAVDLYAVKTCDPVGNGEGEAYLGSVTTSSLTLGTFSLTVPAPNGGAYLTATASGPEGTSEFSACVALDATARSSGRPADGRPAGGG